MVGYDTRRSRIFKNWIIAITGMITTITCLNCFTDSRLNNLTRSYNYPPNLLPLSTAESLLDMMFTPDTSHRARQAAYQVLRETQESTPAINLDSMNAKWGYTLHNLTYETYVTELLDIYQEFFLPLNQKPISLHQILQPNSHQTIFPPIIQDLKRYLSFLPVQTCDYTKTIHTVLKHNPGDLHERFEDWAKMNPDWEVQYHPLGLDEVLEEQFKGTGLEREFEAVKADKVVISSDMVRYLRILLHGGLYTDSDTAPHLPISDWGEIYHIQPLPALPLEIQQELLLPPTTCKDHPGVVITQETDHGDEWYKAEWASRREIIQWTFYFQRGHPIMLDVLGQALRAIKAKRLRTGKGDWEQTSWTDVLKLAGPTAMAQAVQRYFIVKYGLTPERLPTISTALRIGEILMLVEGSFHGSTIAEGVPSCSEHGFRGRWTRKEDS